VCANADAIDPSDKTEPKREESSGSVEPRAAESRQTRSFPTLDHTLSGPLASPAFFTSSLVESASADELVLRQKIEATFEKVRRENRFVKFLDQEALIDLPVGIETELGALKYVILIDSVVMTPTESFLYASMQFELPNNQRKIHFIGRDIKFSKTGGLSGDAKLMLVGDYDQPLDGDKTMLIIKGSREKTFVEFDCNGYKQLSLDERNSHEYQLEDLMNGKITDDLRSYCEETRISAGDSEMIADAEVLKKVDRFAEYLRQLNEVLFIKYRAEELMEAQKHLNEIVKTFTQFDTESNAIVLEEHLAKFPKVSLETLETVSSLKSLVIGWEKYENLVNRLNDEKNVNGLGTLYWGFWALDKEFSEYLYGFQVNLDEIHNSLQGVKRLLRWGGHYRKSHDWMHFEVVQETNDKYLSQYELNQLSLDEVVEKINSISDDKYKIVEDVINGKKVRYCERAN